MALLRSVQEDVLQRLGRVGIVARHAVESLLSGQHRSLHRGLSVEFAGHRPYQPGDDLRHLDWQVFARTDRYDVRVFEEETRLRATLVVDASGSMAYGTRRTKLDYARAMAAALALLMVRQGDSVGLAVIDHRVRVHLPPGGTMGHGLRLLEHLEREEPGGDTALGPVLHQLAARLHRRGLVIVVSDGLDDPASLVHALRHLRHRRQDVRFYHLFDPDERDFPFSGCYDFSGLESEDRIRIDGDRARPYYQQAVRAHAEQIAADCHAAGIHHELVSTDQDLALTLVRSLASLAAADLGARRGA